MPGVKTTYTYPGSKTEHTVTVTTRENTAQVAVRCSCPAYKYSQHHECWHALDAVKKHNLIAVVGGVLYNHPKYSNVEVPCST